MKKLMISIKDIFERGLEISEILRKNYSRRNVNMIPIEEFSRYILIYSLCMFVIRYEPVYLEQIKYHITRLRWKVNITELGKIKTREDLEVWLRDNLVRKLITVKKYGKNNNFIS